MPHYYNDNDPCAAAWLTSLVNEQHLPPGDVDARSITELTPSDLIWHTSHHFFAGIGGWPHALDLAGWPRERPVWTASLPCQPFSQAGKQLGTADERHLWPVFHALVAQCRPPVIVGEQVASKAGRAWLAAVRTDLEALGYAVGAADLCAAGVGAPHIRQRLYWCAKRLADTQHPERRAVSVDREDGRNRANSGREEAHGEPGTCSEVRGLGHAEREPTGWHPGASSQAQGGAGVRAVGDPGGAPGATAGWSDIYYHPCRDGKARPVPVEPGLFPLVDGVPARVGRLRGYGNAIVPQVAAAFIRSVMDVL